MKTEVEKILLNVINDFNSKWTSHAEKDAGVSEYAEKIVKLFSQADVSGSLQDKLFELANDFAVAKQGEVAVKLHSIRNGLQ